MPDITAVRIGRAIHKIVKIVFTMALIACCAAMFAQEKISVNYRNQEVRSAIKQLCSQNGKDYTIDTSVMGNVTCQVTDKDFETILGLIRDGGYDKIVMTKDWHPANHCSFAPQGGPWPAHCVAGTPGAAPFWMLDSVADETILKGQDPSKEEYGVDLLAGKDDNVQIDVVGLCYDYCVANCAKMTSEAHPAAKVTVLAKGCVAIDPSATPDFGKAVVKA